MAIFPYIQACKKTKFTRHKTGYSCWLTESSHCGSFLTLVLVEFSYCILWVSDLMWAIASSMWLHFSFNPSISAFHFSNFFLFDFLSSWNSSLRSLKCLKKWDIIKQWALHSVQLLFVINLSKGFSTWSLFSGFEAISEMLLREKGWWGGRDMILRE